MRLNSLELTRYGKFTDYRIDLGERKAGAPDLHIIYGPNEAGKSTALAAFLDLLFGIEPRSRYGFLHPYSTMRIGASLEIDGASHHLARIKRPQNSLLDGDDRPISDGIILGELGGVDRDSYKTMFSLDDDTLEAGGESILASKGDLGQLLFSASAGLSGLSRTLVDLRTEADGFYKYRARSGELSALKARLADLKAERDRIGTLASEYSRFIQIRDRAAAQYEEAIAKRGQIQSRMDEIQRHLNALPRLTALRGIRERLLPFADLPDAPLGWAEELPKLQKDETELTTRLQGVETEIRQISSEIEAIVVDESALSLADRVDRLADLHARHMTAAKDLPERRLQLREAELAISGILTRIERKGEIDPRRLLLGASTVGALRELIETRSGVEAAIKAAEKELSLARQRLAESLTKLSEAGGKQEAVQRSDTRKTALIAAVAAVRSDDHATRHRLADRLRIEHLETLSDRMQLLLPWAGDVEELVKLPVPETHDIERWKKSVADTQKILDRQHAEIEKLTTEQGRLQAELAAISEIAGVVSDQEAARIRTAREEAWASHRRTLDEASADAFEVTLRHDDIIMNAKLAHATDVAKLHQTSHALAIVNADLNRARDIRDAATADLQCIHDQIATAIRGMTPALSDGTTLAQLDTWLERRGKALESRAALKDANRDILAAEADGVSARKKLIDALNAAGVPFDADASVDALLSIAQAAIDREAELKALRADVEERQRDLSNREHDLEKAIAEEETWSGSWAQVCRGCWLGEDAAIPTLATIREILTALTELDSAIEKHVGLADRTQKMENDQRAFAEEVAAIANLMDVEPPSSAPLELADWISARVQKARTAQSDRIVSMKRVEEARAREQAINEALKIHENRKAEMTAHFGVETLLEVGTKLRDFEKKTELLNQALEAERDILDALGLPSIEDAAGVLDDVNRATLEKELAELKARFDDQDQRTRDLFSEHSKAVDRVEGVGGDDAVARIEERRKTTLLEIEEGAIRYLRLRVGILAAKQALRAYRDRHRSSMMARASDAFRTISRGAYAGLTTQPDKESEILIAVGDDGSSKIASELSKGTRFQLYLSLRVAGYHEFVRSRRPVPFIADDIMETFDDFRAEEAFRLFAEMAQVGQVIYFTHHPHLCEIAQRVCLGVNFHRLENNLLPAG